MTGRFNIILGLVAIILAGITGFAPGLTLERYFQSGYAPVTFWRQLTRVGHTHGMPFGMITIFSSGCSSAVQRARTDSSGLGPSSPLRHYAFRLEPPCAGLQRERRGPRASRFWEAPRS